MSQGPFGNGWRLQMPGWTYAPDPSPTELKNPLGEDLQTVPKISHHITFLHHHQHQMEMGPRRSTLSPVMV